MYVKLDDNGIAHIAQMPDEQARKQGFKLAVFSEKPDTPEGEHPESFWTEESETCTQHWTIAINPDPEIDNEELVDILMGGAE